MWWLWIVIVVLLGLWFLRFTTVTEGRAKVVLRLKSFKRTLLAWGGYKLSKNGKVVRGKTLLRLPGGLRFVGIWPLDKIYKYNFRWRDMQLTKEGEKIGFHEEIIDYIFVRPDVYWTDIKEAETIPRERFPLNIQFLVTMRVSNPYKALFRAPSNWNENVMTRFNALARSWAGTKTLDEILLLKKNPLATWGEFKDDPLLKMFKEEWGLTVEENGIEIREVVLSPKYETAAAAEKKAKFEAVARSAETIGTVLEMMARARGKDVKEIQKEIDASPEMQRELLNLSEDLVTRKIAIEGGSFVDIRVQGAEGLDRTILNALGAWKRMPTGKKDVVEGKEKIEEGEKKEGEDKKEIERRVVEERGRIKIQKIRKREKALGTVLYAVVISIFAAAGTLCAIL